MGIFGKKEDNEDESAAKTVEKEVTKEKKTSKSSKKDEKVKNDVVSTSSAYGTIIAPIVTEKSHAMVADNKYTFRVATKKTTKASIKKVVEEMYGVTVENVNIVVVKPKRRTVKQDRGYQKMYKKAIVTVKKGDHIAVFEGV